MLLKATIFVLLAKSAWGAKILALMVVASHSHHLWNVKYLEALAKRGHHITYLGIDKYENPPANISHILIEDAYETLYGDVEFSATSDRGPYWNTYMLYLWDDQEAAFQIQTPALDRLNSVIGKEKFDLVVHDVGSCVYLLGAVDVLGRPPVIGITAFGIPTWTLEILGNPMAYSSKPYFYTPYSSSMTFFQRMNNFFLHLFSSAVWRLSLRNQNEYSRKCFGQNVRPLNQILDDINIILVNSNYGIDHVFPKVPGLIPIGGLHIDEPKPLPRELKSYLDEAKTGVIFFSLGSNIRSSTLNGKKVEILVEAFRRLAPVQILWKWEAEYLPNKPENVRVGKWFPQNDILAHPNVRLFFTHSGMLSIQEATYHGKPVVGMPFFLDQHLNLKKAKEKGFGEELDFGSLAVDGVVDTIRKVFENPRYQENARKASLIFRDELGNPLERAVYWTEYAIRHGGAPHLRHSARDLTWYQNWMLDILVVIFFGAVLAAIVAARVFRLLTPGGGRRKQKRN